LNILAVDYSTARCGFAVMDNKLKILFYRALVLNKKGEYTHRQRRLKVSKAVKFLVAEYNCKFVVIERLRLQKGSMIKQDVVFLLAGMFYTISNASEVPLYFADTRSWKAKILGNAKADKKRAVRYVEKRYKIEVNHDIADSVCLAEYAHRFPHKLNEVN
jgi:Holliday junction resolvasome RuvABC endonuclease subunit